MTIEQCKIELRKVFSEEELSTKELNDLIAEADTIKSEDPIGFNEKIMQLAEERMLMKKEDAVGKLFAAERLKNLKPYIDAIPDEKFGWMEKKIGFKQRVQKLEAALVGRAEKGRGANLSVEGMQGVFHAQLNNPIDSFITRSGLTPEQLTSKDFGLDTMRELYHLNAKKPGFATENKPAQELAKIYKEQTFVDIRDMFAAAGKSIGYDKNYSGMRRYDRQKVAANKDAFLDFLISDQMSPITFEPGATQQVKLNRALDAWNHIVYSKDQTDFTKHRSLHFSSAEAEHAFMESFGYFDNHFQSMQAQIQNASKVAGLMHTLGPNYKQTWTELRKWADPSDNELLVDSIFEDLSGQLSNAKENEWSKAAAAIRSYISFTKLPNAVVSAFMPDHVSAAALVGAVDGKGLFAGFHNTLANYFNTASALGGKKDRKLLAEAMMLNSFDLVSTYSDNASVGANAKLTQWVTKTFKYTGLTPHSENMRTSVATGIGKLLHSYAELPYADLPAKVKETFDRYTIGEGDWNVMRKAQVEVEGIKLLSPKNILENKLQSKSESLEAFKKFGVLVNDHAKIVTLESSAYSRQSLLWGTREGTKMGELLRFTSQFKQSGIQMMRLQGRLFHSYEAPSYAAAFGAFAMAGYMTSVARDFLVRGVTPETIDGDTQEGRERFVRILLESINRGCGGLLGDTLIAEYDKSYRSLAVDALGPFFSEVNNFAKLTAASARLDLGKHEQEAVGMMQRLTPFVNTMVVKPVIEGIALDFVHNSLNSQYEMNVKRKLRKRGQRRIKDVLLD